jgi:autophagy-related protein 13
VVYKKGIILFRALYSYLSLMPTWKFRRRLAKLKLHTSALKIGCKVQSGYDMARSTPQWDALQVPFFSATEDVTDNFSFGKVESPAGSFSITVSYRKNCDFRVDDSESLLSSHFINLDEHYFRPSLHQRVSTQPAAFAPGRVLEPGSLPAAIPSSFPQRPEPNLAYGSLSSFHQPTGHANASPLAVLRSAAEMADRGSYNASPAERPSSALKSIQDSKSSLRSNDVASMSRRGSLSFQPFKTPSLSASPATPDPYTASSLGRISMPPSVVQTHKHRLSIGTMSPYKSTNSSTPQPQGDPTNQNPIPISTKPHPMTRITSSFGSRRPRVSSAASVTRADDDNSSGHASFSSSVVNPGSGLYPPPGTSSYEEDLQIRDFMSMLADGQKKSLKSLGGGGMSSSASGVKVGNPLSKFQKMKDSQTALVDSMSSSLLLLPSSPSTSSRNLSSVPGMIQSTTFSSSSSPGKPLSPHTPHTPAVPSRLRGLTAQYDQHRDSQRRHPRSTPSSQPRHAGDQRTEGTATTSPLDIPLSPRFMGPRRSNSMSQQHREAIDGNSLEFDPLTVFDNRRRHSSSLGGGDKEPLSTSQLLDLRNASESALSGRETSESGPQRANDAGDDRLAFGPQPLIDNPSGDAPRYAHRFHRGVGMAASGSSYRSRLSSRGRGDTPPMGSTSSLDKNQTGMAINSVRPSIVGRRTPSWPRPNHEDEELLFTMSDMMVAQQSRRSLDQDKTSGSEASSSLSSRRRSRGTSGVHSGQKAGSGGGAGGVGWMAG